MLHFLNIRLPPFPSWPARVKLPHWRFKFVNTIIAYAMVISLNIGATNRPRCPIIKGKITCDFNSGRLERTPAASFLYFPTRCTSFSQHLFFRRSNRNNEKNYWLEMISWMTQARPSLRFNGLDLRTKKLESKLSSIWNTKAAS